jgi:SAM-dependent methyltransferase
LSRVSRVDHELLVGAKAHYEDAAYYTQTYAARIEDVAYYVEHVLKSVARTRTPKVLELGAGNGRITLPLARHGAHVCAVDWSPSMLADLGERLQREPSHIRARVKMKRADIRKVKLREKFDVVLCPFNTALHLFTRSDVEAFLSVVRAHLKPGGVFMADLAVPLPADLARDPAKAHSVPDFDYPGEGKVKYREYFDYDRARQVLFISLEFVPRRDPTRAFVTPVAHRQFYPLEWEALLHYNGFTLRTMHGDFEGGAFTRESDVFISHATVAAPKRKTRSAG